MKKNTLQDAFYLDCGEQATGCGIGHISYFGLEMGQNQHAVIVWDTFLKYLESQKTPVSRIIELGTGAGGLSFLYIDDKRIQESCDKYHLEPCFPEMFLSAAWVCKRREP